MSRRTQRKPLAGLVLRTQPDARLVSLFREGHECAFDEIVRRYRSALVGFAGAIVPRHQAEDVVQESLVRAHAALGGENEIEVRPWLYTIVRNRALNAIRDERPHEHLSEDYDGVPQPPDVLGRRDEMRGLVARIKALPAAQREAIVQRELEGRSHEEIALALGSTPGAVRGLIFRAREGLRAVGGFVIPSTLLQSILESPASTGVIGGAAAGGGGVLMKLGVAATVGVVAVGSGIAIHNHRPSRPGTTSVAESAHVQGSAHHPSAGATTGAPPDASRATAEDSPRSGPGRGGEGGSSASGPGSPGGDSGSSGPGSGASGETSGDDGGSSSSGPGPGDDGSSTSSDDGSSSGSGSDDGSGSGSDDGTSGSSGGTSGSGSGSGSGDDGSSSGSGSGSGSSSGSGSGSDGGTTTSDGGTSGSDGGGSTSSGDGSGADDGSTSGSDDGSGSISLDD